MDALSMKDSSLANSLLEQLDDLLDSQWNDCLPDLDEGNTQIAEPEAGAPVRLGTATSFRQLAPAAIKPGGAGPVPCSPRGRRVPAAPQPPEPLREQDRLLPLANVARLMALELPKDAKISRDAKVLMQEMVTEFICFLTAEAK